MAAGRFTLAAAVILLAVGAMSGCATDSSSSGGPPSAVVEKLIPQSHPPVQDVPVPVGFKIVESKSNAYQTGNVRYVSHYYRGRKGKDVVADFFWEQMAETKWRREGIWKTRGVWRLHFSKGNERADVTIDENVWGTSTAHVSVFPVAMDPAAGGPRTAPR